MSKNKQWTIEALDRFEDEEGKAFYRAVVFDGRLRRLVQVPQVHPRFKACEDLVQAFKEGQEGALEGLTGFFSQEVALTEEQEEAHHNKERTVKVTLRKGGVFTAVLLSSSREGLWLRKPEGDEVLLPLSSLAAVEDL